MALVATGLRSPGVSILAVVSEVADDNMSQAFRILILGGYGTFGAQIARELARDGAIELVIGGRDESRARAFVSQLGSEARHRAIAIDTESDDFRGQLASAAPHLVIHTSGPFQGQDYGVAEACISMGCHYIDLADGREFVGGIGSLDEAARRADVSVVSGASTVPGLSSVVVDELLGPDERPETVDSGITLAHRTPLGPAMVASVMSYCGRPFRRLEQGSWLTRHGWQDIRCLSHPDLGPRLWASCDVPDLDLFPSQWPMLATARFHAAMELRPLQLAVWLGAWFQRWRLVYWPRHAGLLVRLTGLLDRFGTSDGGMFVNCTGRHASGATFARSWWLTARSGDGPFIPCTPSIILARQLAAGRGPAAGAGPCMRLFRLADFDATVGERAIHWAIQEDKPREGLT